MWDFSTEVGLAYDVIISPTVIPYDEFEQYKEKLPYYRNIVKEEEKLDDLVSYRIENVFYFYRSSCGSCERWD